MNLFKKVICFISILAMTSMAGAASYSWNVANDDWSTAAAWDPNTGPPVDGDTATVSNGGTMNISSDQAADLLQIGISGGDGVGAMTGGTLTLSPASGSGFLMGPSNSASTTSFTQSGGLIDLTTLTGAPMILDANAPGETCTYTLEGGTIRFGANGRGIQLGNHTTFTMTGGLISATSSDKWLTIGHGQDFEGSAFNMSGGSVVATGASRIASYDGTSADVKVSGTAYWQQSGDLQINYGYGNFGGTSKLVQEGTSVMTLGGKLIVGARGLGTYEMKAGSMSVGSDMRILDSSDAAGRVEQTGGSVTVAGNLILTRAVPNANSQDPNGKYTLNGAGAVLTVGGINEKALQVGAAACGTFDHINGTANIETIDMGLVATSNSNYFLSGGRLNLGRGVTVTNLVATRNFSLTGGTLAFTPIVDANSNLVTPSWKGMDLKDDGSTLLIDPGVKSTLDVGDPNAAYSNDFILNSGTWVIDIDGLNSADKVNLFSGAGKLNGGTLEVNLLSYTPYNGETFDIVVGTSAPTVSGVVMDDPTNWTVGANGNNIELTYIPEPASMALLGLGGLAMIRRRRR